jgi:hypothetical protein
MRLTMEKLTFTLFFIPYNNSNNNESLSINVKKKIKEQLVNSRGLFSNVGKSV